MNIIESLENFSIKVENKIKENQPLYDALYYKFPARTLNYILFSGLVVSPIIAFILTFLL